MHKHQIVFFYNRNGKKNLNTLLLLYKQSDSALKTKNKLTTKKMITDMHNIFNYTILKEKIIYYNRGNTFGDKSLENIKDKISRGLVSIDKKLAYTNYLYNRL
jgi:hypothetical protein